MRKNAILKKTIGFIFILFYSTNLNAQVLLDTLRIPLIINAQIRFKTDICTDGNGNIHIGLRALGLIERKQGVWSHITTTSSGGQLPSDSIFKLHFDLQSGIWIGHTEGISNETTTGFTNYLFNSSNGFPKRTITALTTDNQSIFVGCRHLFGLHEVENLIHEVEFGQHRILADDPLRGLKVDVVAEVE